MSELSFAALVEQTNACSSQLYQLCQSQQWNETVAILAQREQLLRQLNECSAHLSPAEIEILGVLYQDILEQDKVYLAQAEIERKEVKQQLRHIKRAELNALPAYRNNS